jgi:hypothetical protein
MYNRINFPIILLVCLKLTSVISAASPHQEIDRLILAKAGKAKPSPVADDAEFVRRVYLDLLGRIPSRSETESFLNNTAQDKRTKLIDHLLSHPDHSEHLANQFHIMFMERLGDSPEWKQWLKSSFEKNKKWDQMAKEILRADSENPETRGAAFWMAKRLENYGQNPVDYPALTRDIARLFLGRDLRCAQCHDHLFVKEYKQRDFQGLFLFVKNLSLLDPKTMSISEKPLNSKIKFISVFGKDELEVGLLIPGGKEIDIQNFEKGNEYLVPPDPKTKKQGKLKFSPLQILSEQLPTQENPYFSRNLVNRLWFLYMGRGLVHPLDLDHRDNPPSHPELLDYLSQEFVKSQFNIKHLQREILLSEAYQRSSLMPEDQKNKPESFLTAFEKRLSAEQLMNSVLEALGERNYYHSQKSNDVPKSKDSLETIRAKFLKAFANPPREPEDEIETSLKSALFFLNDPLILNWLNTPREGNLAFRLSKIDSNETAIEEIYLSVLSRRPNPEEKQTAIDYLKKNHDKMAQARARIVWSLLASTEFLVNH